jgi:hypothetical protein
MKKLCLYAAVAALVPAAASAANLTGAWKLDVDVGGQAVPVACNFTQSGAALTGTCNRSDGGEKPAAVTGTVDGSTAKFAYDVSFQDMPLHIAYTATLSSDTAMTGSLDVAGQTGAFKGAKQ